MNKDSKYTIDDAMLLAYLKGESQDEENELVGKENIKKEGEL